MVGSQHRDAAELAYQRGLAALHEARAALAEVEAAQRRRFLDRSGDAAELAARRAGLLADVARLREAAEELRRQLRQHTDPHPAEPDVAPEPPAENGYEQPPFGHPDQ